MVSHSVMLGIQSGIIDPSCPLLPEPQHQSEPSFLTAQVWNIPAVMLCQFVVLDASRVGLV